MTSLLFHQFFLVFSLFALSKTSPLTPLLSLTCISSPSNQALPVPHNPPIKILLDNVTSEVAESLFTITTVSASGHGRFTVLMQCRLGLDRTTCTHCAQDATLTITTLCPGSDAITAWFDGCYIQYYSDSFSNANLGATSNQSCSTRTGTAVDPVQFKPALETLLLKLRAEENLATHHGFSYGELVYSNDSKVYGLVECVRSLSPEECEVCVEEAIGKLEEYCGGKTGGGGTVVSGVCLARFESYPFYRYVGVGGSDSSGGLSGGVSLFGSGRNNDPMGCCKVKVAVVWLGGSAFFIGIIFLIWLFKRSVINRSKVLSKSDATCDYDCDLEEKL